MTKPLDTVEEKFLDWLYGEYCNSDIDFMDNEHRKLVKKRLQKLLSRPSDKLKDILEHNKDDMTGLYDYDGIAQEVIDLVKK